MVAEYLFALYVGTTKEIKAACEFVLYSMIKQLNCAYDEAIFYALPLDSNAFQLTASDIGSELRKVPDLKLDDIVQNVHENVSLRLSENKLLTLDQIKQIDNFVKSETDFGLMLFFGSAPQPLKGSIYQERAYRPYLLQNIVLGLFTIQHKGHMVIKV